MPHLMTTMPGTRIRISRQPGGGNSARVSATHDTGTPRPSAAARWQPILNGIVAAMVILAISAGLWRATGGIDLTPADGGNDGDPGHLAAIHSQAATPSTAEDTEEATTPTGANDRISPPPPPTTEIEETPSVVMPTADDCTIDPLSIDDVLAIVEHPNASAEAPSYITYHTEKSPGSYDKSPGYTLVGSPPSRETLDAIAVDHREYVACAMTGDWFKVWAMSDPSVVYQDVVERLYPIYITRDEARSLLQELQANGKAGELPSLAERWGQFEFVTLVDPQPENSNHFYDVEVQLGTVMYDAQGRRVLDSEDPAGLRSQEEGRVDLTYVWSERHGRWLYFLPKWGPA